MMKNYIRFCILLVISGFVLLSCNKDFKSSGIVQIDIQELVNLYADELNARYGTDIFELKNPIVYNGKIRIIGKKTETNQSKFDLLIEGFDEVSQSNIARGFGVAVDQEGYYLPNVIETGQLIFLGNQLIINDYDNNKQHNFFVPITQTTLNKVKNIEPIITNGLSIFKEADMEGLMLRSEGNCECSCVICSDPQNCGSSSCSCSSSCGGCEQECRSGYNAVCKNNCIEQ